MASLSPNIVTPVSSELGVELEVEVLYCPRMILSILVHHHITYNYNDLLPIIPSWISPMCCRVLTDGTRKCECGDTGLGAGTIKTTPRTRRPAEKIDRKQNRIDCEKYVKCCVGLLYHACGAADRFPQAGINR